MKSCFEKDDLTQIHDIVTFLILINLLIINLFVRVNMEEGMEYCDTFYEEHDKSLPQMFSLNCIKQHKENTIPGSQDHTNHCRENQLNGSNTEYNILYFMNCTLAPGVFDPLQFFKVSTFVLQTETPVLWNNTFRGICEVENIDLSNNSIKHVEPRAFICLTAVYKLDLSKNLIEHLPHNVFINMQKMEILDLSYNQIRALSVQVFYGLSRLLKLNLNHNNFRNFSGDRSCSEGMFYPFTELSFLDLSDNMEWDLNNSSFCRLFYLNHLVMERCNISFLSGDIFRDNKLLKSLFLSHNRIKYMMPDFFSPLIELETLDLSFNTISILSNETFKQNINMAELNLSQNYLSHIEEKAFEGLYSIRYLDISGNTLVRVPSFEIIENLIQLNISHNRLASLPGTNTFENNVELRVIDLSFNNLTHIRSIQWQRLAYLQEFRVTNNEITKLLIPEIHNNPEIHLERNQVQHIYVSPENFINYIPSLKKTKIFLSGNPLNCDCDVYELHKLLNGNHSLQRIDFVDGLICKHPLNHSEKKLKEVDFSDLGCVSCPERCSCDFEVYDYVQNKINCSNRKYDSLPFTTSPNASVLYIDHNNLKNLEGLNASRWKSLLELHAQGNQIAFSEFYLPKNLNFLSLIDNKMTKLPEAVRDHAKNMKDFKITLSNNPWPCDCSAVPFKNFLYDYQAVVVDAFDVQCIFPNGSLSTNSLVLMKEEEFCIHTSVYTSSATVYALIISASLLILSSVLAFYYRNKLRVLLFLYINCTACRSPDGDSKIYDCFISYSSEDIDVTLAIIEELEKNPPHFTFCIHERNWAPGEYITKNIVLSVQNSRKTLIVLSKTFVKSQWFHLEFEAAYHQSIKDKRNRLIFVLKGDLPDESDLEKDVKEVLSTVTYLQWGERWFWDKLRNSLADPEPLMEVTRECSFLGLCSCTRRPDNLNSSDIPMQ